MDVMRRKYGDKSLKYLNVWTTEFEFPVGGSFSVKNVTTLETKLKEKEQLMRSKRKISIRKLELMESQMECLKMWKEEAESRNRKTVMKQLPFLCVKKETDEMLDSHSKRTKDSQISSSLNPQLTALKLDPDLDGSSPSAPPPYCSTTPSGEEQADSRTQQNTNSRAAHPDAPVSPQNSIEGLSSPIAHRLRNPNQDAAFNMPMVEVSGPQGATLVFRAWTSADITAASQHLPNPAASGKQFAEEFSTFCQEFKPTANELKRLLITKMKPTDWKKISGKFPEADIRCKHITWEDESNAQYREFVTRICEAFTQVFPVKIHMERITACKQRDGENPDEYLTRLTEIFSTYSGLEQSDVSSNTPGVWEIHLSNYFLSGLKPEVASAVKSSCIGWNDARLSELRRHAIHAHDQIISKKKKKEETTQKELHMAAVTMYNTARGHGHKREKRDQGKNWKKRSSISPNDVCHHCGQVGHWRRNCPARSSQNSEGASD